VKGGKKLVNKAVIIPTGDEIKEGIVLDTDSPMVMSFILKLNGDCHVERCRPTVDDEANIEQKIQQYLAEEFDLIILIGGSGGGHRYSKTLGKDFTHSALGGILDDKVVTELYGKNGHLWSKLIAGRAGKTLVINIPGPFAEAEAAMSAFVETFKEIGVDLKRINASMAEAVKKKYSLYNGFENQL
jgi:molybdopterin biosynthesis enzyme